MFADYPRQQEPTGLPAYTAPSLRGEPGVVLVTERGPERYDSVALSTSRLDVLLPGMGQDRVTTVMDHVNALGIYVYPLNGNGKAASHNSYIAAYGGRRIYFSGTSTDVNEVLGLQGIDVFFLNPALVQQVSRSGRKLGGRLIVMYGIAPGEYDGKEPDAPCERCTLVVPKVGEIIQLFR